MDDLKGVKAITIEYHRYVNMKETLGGSLAMTELKKFYDAGIEIHVTQNGNVIEKIKKED